MEWHNDSFNPSQPEPPPKIPVTISILQKTHKRFGKGDIQLATNALTDAIADSGCQTCTAGPEILTKLRCPHHYLVKTRHKIIGITDTPLHIIGTLFLRISFGNKSSNQMVYISKNCRGLYLSQTAMKDLGIVEDHFPDSKSAATKLSDKCGCPPRTKTPERPEVIPFAPTDENVPKLKEWLLDAFASSAFNQCPHQELPTMTGEPIKLHLKDNAVPYAAHTPIPVPHHWKKQVKNDLDRDERLGIIEKVPQGTTTKWCARMVVTPKKNGEPRRTVDLQKLNNATLRETHHTPSPFNIVSTVPVKTRKSVLDAWNGYHSLPLHESTKESMTFITEWGRYRYCRAPMGYHVSGDAYTRRFDDITSECLQVARIVDDSLLWDYSISESFWHTFDYLKLCADNGVVFNKDKFQFAQQTVEFAGFEITQDGYRPLKKIISAITEFPSPRCITDVRSWFGLVNQLAYAFAQAPIMEPFRQLLSAKAFYWDDTLEKIFEESKKKIVALVSEGVKTFESERPTCLATDWSKTGIGFHLTQKHCSCTPDSNPNCGKDHWKLVFAGSRFTNEAESRYAPIEGEALAVVHGLQRCRMFVLGSPNLIIAVDHKPLVGILNDRELSTIDNPRLLQLKEKTLMYRFRIIHAPGKSEIMKIPDTTSRNPVPEVSDDISTVCEAAAISYARDQAEGINAVDWQTVQHHAAHDDECITLSTVIQNGFPKTKAELPLSAHPYWNMREDLYVINGVPFKGNKMLIPKQLRRIVLEGLHASHQGVSSMLANARQRLFWPGLDAAIKLYREQCRQCNEQAPSQAREPTIEPKQPEVPFEIVAMDLCKLSGFSYLIYVDAYSGWIEVSNLTSSNAQAVRKVLMMYFAIFGVPEEIATDGGPPFESQEYNQLLKQWNIRKRLSSAYYPKSNGRAEAGVKTAKRILLGNVDPRTGKLDNDKAVKALLVHRNTPCQLTGISPAVALFGRPIRDHLPAAKLKLRQEWQDIYNKREEALAKRHLIAPIDHSPTRELPPLNVGDSVQIQNQSGTRPTKWSNTGYVAESLPNRQYKVIVDGSRRVTLRNRRFLKQILPVCRQVEQSTPPLLPTRPKPQTLEQVEEPVINHVPPVPAPALEQNPRGEEEDVPIKQIQQIIHEQPRRSDRIRRAPRPLSPRMSGKSHA